MRSLLHHFFIALLCGTFVAGHTPALIHHASCNHSVDSSCEGHSHVSISHASTPSCACTGHDFSTHHESSPYQASLQGAAQAPESDSHHHDASNCLICQSLTGLNAAILISPPLQISANSNEPTGSTEQMIDWSGQHLAFLARGPPALC